MKTNAPEILHEWWLDIFEIYR